MTSCCTREHKSCCTREHKEHPISDPAAYRYDPLGFVQAAFPWGEGELSGFTGPQDWQIDTLTTLCGGEGGSARSNLDPACRQVVRLATASGHGIGKSALVSWIILWAMLTQPDTRGIVTANTETQLKTKTWTELGKWYRLCGGANNNQGRWTEGFKYGANALLSTTHPQNWRIDKIAWSERNPEAFAGLHNQGKRILVVFDEASAIDDLIWEVTEGALTDENTDIIWAVFGNPTRNSGRFFECFHRFRHRWACRKIDSRTAAITNRAQIAQWAEDHGEDSDFFKVRVRGEFPATSAEQFIGSGVVAAAVDRSCPPDGSSPVVIGVDCARFGDDQSVILTRQGRKVLEIIKLRDKRGHDIARKVFETSRRHGADALFIDGGGVGASTCDALHAMGVRHVEVGFGERADNNDDNGFANRRAEMWGRMKSWLERADIPNDPELIADLGGPEYSYDSRMRVVLEKKADMKARGLASPDVGDALAVTFAEAVQGRAQVMPFADEHYSDSHLPVGHDRFGVGHDMPVDDGWISGG